MRTRYNPSVMGYIRIFVPVKPSYGKFGKETLSAHFLKFYKVTTRRKFSRKKATKNTLAQMPSSAY